MVPGVISTTYGAVLDSQKQKRIKRCSRGSDLNIMWKQGEERSLETSASGEKTRDKQSNYAPLRFSAFFNITHFGDKQSSRQADKQSNYALLSFSAFQHFSIYVRERNRTN